MSAESSSQPCHILKASYESDVGNVCKDVTAILQRHMSTQEGKLILNVQTNVNQLFGDPAYGRPKRLRVIFQSHGKTRETIIAENGNFLVHPLYLNGNAEHGKISIDPLHSSEQATVECILSGGLCNQIYGLASLFVIAKKLNRAIPWSSLRFLSRRTVNDSFQASTVQGQQLRVQFEQLFDSHHLQKHCPVPIVVKDQNSAYTFSNLPRYLPSSAIESTLHSTSQAIAINSMVFQFINPTNKEDYETMLPAFHACVPCSRLMAIAQKIRSHLGTEYACFHYRCEQDFRRIYPQHFLPMAKAVQLLQTHSLLKSAPKIYIVGQMPPEVLPYLRAQVPNVVYKNDAIPGIDQSLGFEELAVIDREISITGMAFVGHAISTFSMAVVLQRNSVNCDFYGSDQDLRITVSLFGPNRKRLFAE